MIMEVSPARTELAREIGRRLADDSGVALVIDYGAWVEGQTGDTLQATRRHAPCDPLDAPGTADLTTHVEFGALAGAAAAGGAGVYGPVPQGTFLTTLGIHLRTAKLVERTTPDQRRALRAALFRLTDASAMGELFKVLVLEGPRRLPRRGSISRRCGHADRRQSRRPRPRPPRLLHPKEVASARVNSPRSTAATQRRRPPAGGGEPGTRARSPRHGAGKPVHRAPGAQCQGGGRARAATGTAHGRSRRARRRQCRHYPWGALRGLRAVLLADAAAGVIGAAHAGWRGALAGVVEATVEAMVERGAARERVVAVIGPCIAKASYEVGPELLTQFTDYDANSAALFEPVPGSDRLLFDLKAYVLRRLEAAGIEQRAALPDDTHADETRFFSARRSRQRGADRFGLLLSGNRARRVSRPLGLPSRPNRPTLASSGKGRYAMSSGHPHRSRPSLVRATALPQTGTRGRASRTAMADLVAVFVDSLSEAQRRRTLWPFDEGERFNWHYVPRERAGLPVQEMSATSKSTLHELLRYALSEAGYQKAVDVMSLEEPLGLIENHQRFYRHSENYSVTVFGTPGRLPWGWRIEGHHLSLNFTAGSEDLFGITPAFWGANPARVPDGYPMAGHRMLGRETDLSFS